MARGKKKSASRHLNSKQLAELVAHSNLSARSVLSLKQMQASFKGLAFDPTSNRREIIHEFLDATIWYRNISDFERARPKKLSRDKRVKYWGSLATQLDAGVKKLAVLLEEISVTYDYQGKQRTHNTGNWLFYDFQAVAEPTDPFAFAPKRDGDAARPRPPKHLSVRAQLEATMSTMKWGSQVAIYLKNEAEAETSRSGNKPDKNVDNLIKALADIYEKAVRNLAPAPTYSDLTSSYSGDFLDFAGPCFKSLEPEISNSGLAQRIERVFKTRVRSAASYPAPLGLLAEGVLEQFTTQGRKRKG